MKRERALRSALLSHARALAPSGLSSGTSGNVSVRVGAERFLVTPSGARYESLKPRDLPLCDLDGNAMTRGLAPSSEWRIHRDVYSARPDVGAVVHAHAPQATALACLDRGLPAFHYMVAAFGGHDVRCAPYATFGTEELSRGALEALDGRHACLLAHHGLVALGEHLEQAFERALLVEELAGVYLSALSVGEPAVLDQAEMARVVERFAGYGQAVAG